MAVREHLNFHVTSALNRLFDDERVGAEGIQGLGTREVECSREVFGAVHESHASTAAAGGRLDHHGEADVVGRGDQGRVRLIVTLVAGYAWDVASSMAVWALALSPMTSIAWGGGPMNVRFASAQARAKAAFSERKP